jgi:hypothetical protein
LRAGLCEADAWTQVAAHRRAAIMAMIWPVCDCAQKRMTHDLEGCHSLLGPVMGAARKG